MIDFLKAIAILGVLSIHAFPNSPASSWLALSLPLFLGIMLYNFYGSFKKKFNGSLIEYYPAYLKDKAIRFLPSLAVMVAILYAYIGRPIEWAVIATIVPVFDWGYSPLFGPGAWFLPALFAFIWVFPILAWLFYSWPLWSFRLAYQVKTPIDLIGKASYHIFLYQCAYFFITSNPLGVIGVLICVIMGIAFYVLEKVVKCGVSYMRDRFIFLRQ